MSKALTELLEEKILQNIPLTKHMGLKVRYYDGNELRLYSAIEKNINHRQTAFAGSITSLATLAGWGLIYLKLYELHLPARIVIQTGTTNYLHPITADFEAMCKIEDTKKFDKFIDGLQRKHIARLSLHSIVKSQNIIAAELLGDFVAKKIHTP